MEVESPTGCTNSSTNSEKEKNLILEQFPNFKHFNSPKLQNVHLLDLRKNKFLENFNAKSRNLQITIDNTLNQQINLVYKEEGKGNSDINKEEENGKNEISEEEEEDTFTDLDTSQLLEESNQLQTQKNVFFNRMDSNNRKLDSQFKTIEPLMKEKFASMQHFPSTPPLKRGIFCSPELDKKNKINQRRKTTNLGIDSPVFGVSKSILQKVWCREREIAKSKQKCLSFRVILWIILILFFVLKKSIQMSKNL